MQGEQVFISYGPQGNDSLLQFYGFVEAGNPHDAHRVPQLAARARAAAASLGVDAEPAPDKGVTFMVRLALVPATLG